MSDVSKTTLYVAPQPALTGPTVSKTVLYVAYSTQSVEPVRKRVHGRIRYGTAR